jgi:hypothetical protein
LALPKSTPPRIPSFAPTMEQQQFPEAATMKQQHHPEAAVGLK